MYPTQPNRPFLGLTRQREPLARQLRRTARRRAQPIRGRQRTTARALSAMTHRKNSFQEMYLM